MTKDQLQFINQIVKVNKDKVAKTLSEELKGMYRYSIKSGQRKQFVDQVRKNSLVVKTIDDKTFLSAGSSMFALAELLGEYLEFQHWINKMTGNNF